MRKKRLNRTEVVTRYGEDVKLIITRKDGNTVSLDFRCPELIPTPEKFLGSKPPRDPLAVTD